MFKKKKPEARQSRRPASTSSIETRRPAFSYHAQRQQNEDGSVRDRLRLDDGVRLGRTGIHAKIHALISGNVVWALATAGLIVLLLVNSFVDVKHSSVVVHGTPEQRVLLSKSEAYENTATDILLSSPAYRLKLTADTDGFNEQFIKKYPEIASARLELPLFGQQPKVHLTPAVPAVEFTSSRSETYIVDKTGRVIQAAQPGALSIPHVQDESAFRAQKGSQALSSRDVSFIVRLNQQLSVKNIEVQNYIIPPTSRQLVAQIKGKPYVIKFTFENDVLQQAGAVVATQQKLSSMKVTPAEYIDVRVGDRVYYK